MVLMASDDVEIMMGEKMDKKLGDGGYELAKQQQSWHSGLISHLIYARKSIHPQIGLLRNPAFCTSPRMGSKKHMQMRIVFHDSAGFALFFERENAPS